MLTGVEQINADFAEGTTMLENFTEVSDSQQGKEFDCTQDPEDFARRLGIGTQKINEISVEVEKELLAEENERLQQIQDKENRSPTLTGATFATTPPGRKAGLIQTSLLDKVDGCLLYPLQDLGEPDVEKKQKLKETTARVQRAKDKVALDEAARRRTERNRNKDEGQTMDKATEMVRKKNLEKTPDSWIILQKKGVQKMLDAVSKRLSQVASEVFRRAHGWGPAIRRLCC